MTAWFPPVMEIVIEGLVIQMTEVILPTPPPHFGPPPATAGMQSANKNNPKEDWLVWTNVLWILKTILG